MNSTLQSLRAQVAALQHLRPFLATVWQASPSLATVALVLRIVEALLPVVILYIGKLIIDDVVHLAQLHDKPQTLAGWLASGHVNRLGMLLAAEFAVMIVDNVMFRISTLLTVLLAQSVGNVLSQRLVEHAARLDLANFEDAEFLDRLERARRQASGSNPLVGELLSQVEDVVTTVSLIAGVIVLAPWLILVLLVALVPTFLGETHFNASSYALDVSRTAQAREIEYLRQVSTTVDAAKEVKLFDVGRFIADRFRRLNADQYTAYSGLAVRRALWLEAFSAVGTVGYYASYGYIAWRTIAGALTIGDLTFLAESIRRLRELIEGLLSSLSHTAARALYLRDLYSFLAAPAQPRPAAAPRAFPRPVGQGFTFENVGFRYPGTERWVLRGLSFTLEAGKITALVGESGAGKSTVVKLLTRLYRPTEGRILLDGHDLADYDVGALHARMGVVFQDYARYNFSAAENIAAGEIVTAADRERVEQAARRGYADGIIARLPDGYAQMIGKRFYKGVDLSGGEWQRIALARAYGRDADVLVLDEPSSSLDARSEVEVLQRLRAASAETVLIVMHRLASVRAADRIVVLSDGRAEAVGTHEELIQRPGLYADLFALQAKGYR